MHSGIIQSMQVSIWNICINKPSFDLLLVCYLPLPVRYPSRWRYNELDGVSNHQPHDCLLNRLFKAPMKETSKLCVAGLCAGNSPVTGEFPVQRARNAENISIWCLEVMIKHNKHSEPQTVAENPIWFCLGCCCSGGLFLVIDCFVTLQYQPITLNLNNTLYHWQSGTRQLTEIN